MKLHLIWDLDGTLVNSEPEILATIQKALAQVGISIHKAMNPLRIGPPLPTMLRNAFMEEDLSDGKLRETVLAFRKIYDSSDFEATLPFEGIDELVCSTDYVHHVITNKPFLATSRIIERKGWGGHIVEILTPDALMETDGRQLSKMELFQHFRSAYPDVCAVGIGDMANDAACAKSVGLQAVGVLWGTGTKAELQEAGCDAIVADASELKAVLKQYGSDE